jgi:hypothetical protein
MLKKDHRRRPSPKALFPPTNKIKYSKKTNNHPHPFPQNNFFLNPKTPSCKTQNLKPKTIFIYNISKS